MPEEKVEVMADLPISALPPTVTPTATDEIAQEQIGTTKKINLQQLADFVGGNITTLTDKEVVYGGPAGEMAQTASWTFDDVALRMQFGAAHVASTGTTSGMLGGAGHQMNGDDSIIAGGASCSINGLESFIGGSNGCTIDGLRSFIGGSSGCTVSGSSSAVIGSSGCDCPGSASAMVGSTTSSMGADLSFLSGSTIDMAAGVEFSAAMGSVIFVDSSAIHSYTWSDGSGGTFTITEPRSWNVRSSGNSQFDIGDLGTLKIGDIPEGDYIEITNTQVRRVGNLVRRKILSLAEYDDGGTGSSGTARPYPGISTQTFDSGADERMNLVDTIFPYDFDPTVNIEVELIWMPTTASSGNVEWALWYSFLTPDGTNVLASNNIRLDATLPASTNLEQPETHIFTLNTAGALPGDELFTGLIRRGGLGTDTYPDDVWVTSLRSYYFSNQL